MSITNMFYRRNKDAYVIEWIEETHCLVLLIDNYYIDSDGKRVYTVDDIVHLERGNIDRKWTWITASDRVKPKRFKASSRAYAIGKFNKCIEIRRRALEDFTCGL